MSKQTNETKEFGKLMFDLGKQETLKQVNNIISRFKCKGELTLDGCFIWNVSEVDEFDKEMEKLK